MWRCVSDLRSCRLDSSCDQTQQGGEHDADGSESTSPRCRAILCARVQWMASCLSGLTATRPAERPRGVEDCSVVTRGPGPAAPIMTALKVQVVRISWGLVVCCSAGGAWPRRSVERVRPCCFEAAGVGELIDEQALDCSRRMKRGSVKPISTLERDSRRPVEEQVEQVLVDDVSAGTTASMASGRPRPRTRPGGSTRLVGRTEELIGPVDGRAGCGAGRRGNGRWQPRRALYPSERGSRRGRRSWSGCGQLDGQR